MSLRVLSIGSGATLQDSGRRGFRRFGVPTSGPFDVRSAVLANSLLGNSRDAAVLEMPTSPAEFEAVEPTAFALFGPGDRVKTIRSQPHGYGDTYCLLPGDRIVIGDSGEGCRLYLALPGGIVGQETLGSVSGQPVREGTVLKPCTPGIPSRRAGLERFAFKVEPTLVARPGPHFKAACGDGREFEMVVDHRIDRRGVRLMGSIPNHDLRLPSEPVAIGSIQWTPGGEWIVIGPDGPTLGGYPKIGYLLRRSVNACAQLRPGDKVQVKFVSEEEAQIFKQKEREEMDAISRLSQIVMSY